MKIYIKEKIEDFCKKKCHGDAGETSSIDVQNKKLIMKSLAHMA